MLLLRNKVLQGNWDKEVANLPFFPHTDYDLLGNEAVAFRSEDGKINTFYRSKQPENPANFHYTKLYYACPELKKLIEYFKVEKTRIRIHKQRPGINTRLHSDYQNKLGTTFKDYLVRVKVGLTYSPDFEWHFKLPKEDVKTYELLRGQCVLFDPDIIWHGMANNSKIDTRYSLLMMVKPNKWLYDFFKETL